MTRRFKIWDKVNNCWSWANVYVDDEGDLYEIYERTRGSETFMHKENVNAKYDIAWFVGVKDANGIEIYEGCICKIWMDGVEQTPLYLVTSAETLYSDTNRADGYLRIGRLEVVGNRFQDTEMLNRVGVSDDDG